MARGKGSPVEKDSAALRRELAGYHGLMSAWATIHGVGDAPDGDTDAHNRRCFSAWLDEQRVKTGAWRAGK